MLDWLNEHNFYFKIIIIFFLNVKQNTVKQRVDKALETPPPVPPSHSRMQRENTGSSGNSRPYFPGSV